MTDRSEGERAATPEVWKRLLGYDLFLAQKNTVFSRTKLRRRSRRRETADEDGGYEEWCDEFKPQ